MRVKQRQVDYEQHLRRVREQFSGSSNQISHRPQEHAPASRQNDTAVNGATESADSNRSFEATLHKVQNYQDMQSGLHHANGQDFTRTDIVQEVGGAEDAGVNSQRGFPDNQYEYLLNEGTKISDAQFTIVNDVGSVDANPAVDAENLGRYSDPARNSGDIHRLQETEPVSTAEVVNEARNFVRWMEPNQTVYLQA